MKMQFTIQKLKLSKKYLISLGLVLIPSTVFANSLCYPTASYKAGRSSIVQMFKGLSCPRGYSKITQTALLAGLGVKNAVNANSFVGAQGETGAQGVAGIQGPTGSKGPAGIKGESGEIGPQGELGEQGPKGPTGILGAKGLQGPQGANGFIGFNFHGSTGSNLVTAPDNTPDYWSVGDVDGASTSKGNTDEEIGALFGSPCSLAEVFLTVAEAPGAGKSWKASLGIKLPNGIAGTSNACTISGSDQSCSGTLRPIVELPALAMIRIGITPIGSPAPVQASWNVRCIVP